ncbi:MAG: hypothetical protein KGR98_03000 [Verrucomicrobia bacterium]|nr:hypothetical protein [Verrucomicrobiota bacterium]MDE3100232.1 hypothetical protein [Verrucomicrobiota bacterium]
MNSYDIQFWIRTVILLMVFLVLVTTKKARGTGWLLGYVGISLFLATAYYVPVVLQRNETITPDALGRFLKSTDLVFGILGVCGSALLLVYVIVVKGDVQPSNASGDDQHVKQQAATDHKVMGGCAFGGAVVFAVFNFATGGAVPGGLVGGMIGAALGALVGMAVNSMRRK